MRPGRCIISAVVLGFSVPLIIACLSRVEPTHFRTVLCLPTVALTVRMAAVVNTEIPPVKSSLGETLAAGFLTFNIYKVSPLGLRLSLWPGLC